MSAPLSKANALKHYEWAAGCEGWNFVDVEALSVKQERMAGETSEALHYHQKAQQFFFILKGTAHFEVEGEEMIVSLGEGLHIEAGKKHKIINKEVEPLEFILCSQPSTANDRINCHE